MPAKKKITRRSSGPRRSRKHRLLLPYPLILLILLCVGVFLTAWTLKASGDDIFVSAKVSGLPITSPPAITGPTNGVHFSVVPITVKGTCPANASYVKISRNNLMSGSAICQVGNTFELTVDLFPAQNNLVAHAFNITDDEGPVSDTVTVYYDVPVTPSGSSQPSDSYPSSGTKPPLVIQAPFVYKGFQIGESVEWPVEISGGIPPYAVDVDWGDQTHSLYSRSTEGVFTISHKYSKPGGYRGSYIIRINAADSEGTKSFLQFFIIVAEETVSGTFGNIFTKPSPTIKNNNWLWVAWPSYLIVTLLALSFWLGEREEIIILRRRGLLH